jgi:ATP-dependent DNA helicase PIF1
VQKFDIIITDEYKRCFELIEKDTSVIFISGQAGTGKSVLIDIIKERYHDEKNIVVAAPTGVTALNVEGQTLHSLFRLPLGLLTSPDKLLSVLAKIRKTGMSELYEKIDMIIIDEISMVRPDSLDAIDFILRAVRGVDYPFGGVQIINVGDMFQIPPVITDDERAVFDSVYGVDYFFGSKVVEQLFSMGCVETVHLTHTFRQKDPLFIDILNTVRVNKKTDRNIEILNEYCYNSKCNWDVTDDRSIRLCTTNKNASVINDTECQRIDSRQYTFTAVRTGEFNTKLVTPDILHLKVGCKVMFTRNDVPDRRWVNGTIGIVTDITSENICIRVPKQDDIIYEVERVTWEHIKYDVIDKIDDAGKVTRTVGEVVVGTFNQFPLALAYALTIHKCMDGDTEVSTKAGPKKLRDIVVGDLVFTSINPDDSQRLRPVIAKMPSNKKSITIITKTGNKIVCSKEHRLLIQRSKEFPLFIEAGDFKIGDRIASSCSKKQYNDPVELVLDPIKQTPVNSFDWGWCLGVLIGDGCYSISGKKDHRIDITTINEHSPILKKWKSFFEDLGVRVTLPSVGSRDVKTACIHSKVLRTWLFDNGFDYITANFKKIPHFCKTNTIDFRRGIISGLFDTDGYISKQGDKAIFTTSSETLARDVKSILQDLGVISHLYTNNVKSYHVTVTGNSLYNLKDILVLQECYKNTNLQQAKQCKRSNWDTIRFNQSICSELKTKYISPKISKWLYTWNGSDTTKTRTHWLTQLKKENMYDVLNIETRRAFNEHTFYDPIVDIIYNDNPIDMYDIEIQDDHQFIANGTISHNCQGLTFDKVSLDLGGGCFAAGQCYVALSRCTSIDGLHLVRKIAKTDIYVDQRIVEFYECIYDEDEISKSK